MRLNIIACAEHNHREAGVYHYWELEQGIGEVPLHCTRGTPLESFHLHFQINLMIMTMPVMHPTGEVWEIQYANYVFH